MKNIFKLVARCIALVAILNTVSNSNTTFAQETENVLTQPGAKLPDFEILTVNNKTLTQKDLRSKGNRFVVLFNPTCDHCMELAAMFHNNAANFKNNDVYFISTNNMMPYFNYFLEKSGVPVDTYIKIGEDKKNLIELLYLYGQLPQIQIYSNKNQLIKVLAGGQSFETLRAYTQ